jgi:hypothetical protein
MLQLPTGDAERGLGEGHHSIYLPVWFQTTRGPWTTFGGGGYRFNAGAGRRNVWAGGWSLLYQFTDKLQMGGEVFGSTRAALDGQSMIGFHLGGTYRLGEHFALLFSAGHGLKHAPQTNAGATYVGLRQTF